MHDPVARVTRPVRELRGFQRVELAPGETRNLTFKRVPQDLRYWGLENKWVVEPGLYEVYLATAPPPAPGPPSL